MKALVVIIGIAALLANAGALWVIAWKLPGPFPTVFDHESKQRSPVFNIGNPVEIKTAYDSAVEIKTPYRSETGHRPLHVEVATGFDIDTKNYKALRVDVGPALDLIEKDYLPFKVEVSNPSGTLAPFGVSIEK